MPDAVTATLSAAAPAIASATASAPVAAPVPTDAISQNEALVGTLLGTLTHVVLPALALACAAVALALAARAVSRRQQRRAFESRYRVGLPDVVRVRRLRASDAGTSSFELGFPTWEHAKADGTRDLRRASDEVLTHASRLLTGRWELTSDDPFALYDLACALRDHGVAVPLCAEENLKLKRLSADALSRAASADAGSIVGRFADDPLAFEGFCANLMSALGWRAEVTRPTADGGYDLLLVRDGVTWAGECKLFSTERRVGRPLLQKLDGANAALGADRTMFLTTASFTSEAVAYAAEVGMELVDGARLSALCREAWGEGGSASVTEPSLAEARLTRDELLSFLPDDMVARYHRR